MLIAGCGRDEETALRPNKETGERDDRAEPVSWFGPGEQNGFECYQRARSKCYQRARLNLDRAIALFIALLLMARSSRAMTFHRFTLQGLSVTRVPACLMRRGIKQREVRGQGA